MPKRSPKILVEDMLVCIQNIFDDAKNLDYPEFLQARTNRDAIIRNLEVLGEAANRIPKVIRDQYPEIEWGRIIRTRNIVIHDYEVVNYEIVWRIITVHLPPLKTSLEKILPDLE